MKVLHLSTGDTRGAFTGAYRVHSTLKEFGFESIMFVADKVSNDSCVVSVAKAQYFLFRAYNLIWKLLNKTLFRSRDGLDHHFLNDYFGISTKIIRKKYNKGYFDYIFIYYTSNFLSTSEIRRLAKFYSARLVFYPMDMASLTGGCHYAWACEGYKKTCENCEVVSTKIASLLIKNNFINKQKMLAENNSLAFAGSELLNKQLKDSLLFKNIQVYKNLLPIDEMVFSPVNRAEIRSKLGFNDSEFIIYFGAQSLDDPRKGIAILLEALALLFQKKENGYSKQITLLSVGRSKPKYHPIVSNFSKTIHLDFIYDQKLFSGIYSAVDLFISPSIEDSGPMMVNESILSGTPVVAFKTGVALDLVKNGCSGFLADSFSSESLLSAINKILLLDLTQYQSLRESTRNIGLKLTSKSKHFAITEKTLKLVV